MKAHDLIKEFAAKQLGIPADQVTPEQRRQFKAATYMYMYTSVTTLRPPAKDKP